MNWSLAAKWGIGACLVAAVACGGGSTGPGDAGKDAKDVHDVAVAPDNAQGEDVGATGDVAADERDAADGTCEGCAADVTGEDTGEDAEVLCLGQFNCPCNSNDDCNVYCVPTMDGQRCTKKCSQLTDCPDGWGCQLVLNTEHDPIYICIPVGITQCKPCDANADCASSVVEASDYCVPFGAAGSFCGTQCGGASDAPCPSGTSCQDVTVTGGSTQKQCVPDSGQCACSKISIDAMASTTCFINNSFGTCFGHRTCQASGLTDCDARKPAKESCNGIDDNCDGVTDPDGSDGCVTYYQDNDGDGYGIGVGKCQCKDPGPGWSTKSGDCNDSNNGMHPGVQETCNGMDDDCDGVTDPEGSIGCTNYYLDADGDGYTASPNDFKCLCNPTPPYTAKAAAPLDCDDTTPDVCPDPLKCPEKCDGIDNDCDGVTDGENSKGCQPWYYDEDQDGFGLGSKFKCLCGTVGYYSTQKAGDCNDQDPTINPLAPEQCNGKDDNCNGLTDEDPPETMCPPKAGVTLHGTVGCSGKCVMTTCDGPTTDGQGAYVPGWYDVNTDSKDGCECQADVKEQAGGATCATAIALGAFPDSGFKMLVDGNLVPATDEDWYSVDAQDPTWNSEADGGDHFNLRVVFTVNPNNAFILDVMDGTCAGTSGDHSGKCVSGGMYEYSTAFLGSWHNKPNLGESPCVTDNKPVCDAPLSQSACNAVEGTQEKCNPCPGVALAGANLCSDNSERFYIRVYRDPTKAVTCMPYQLEVSNGLYPFSGQ